ncbi:MAG: DUF547 domain-containing protein [Deltaproteobacteria bacterium]|nr:DUF547 domain-containing protein [Deltaproteobacteria bacterium]
MKIGPGLRLLRDGFCCMAVMSWLLFQPALVSAEDFNQELYAQLLLEYTLETDSLPGTLVDYKGLKKEERWSALIRSLAASKPSTLSTQAEKKAYRLNAYNVLAVDTVIEHYPVKSIRDVGSLFSPVWEREAIKIEGKPFSLSHIEHEILRPMGDPRVHAGIVCASKSCPSLLREPWRAEDLDAQLDGAMRRWLTSRKKGLRIDRDTRDVWISRIFKWFSEDFAGEQGTQLFLIQYAPPEEAAWLRKNRDDFSLSYFPYNWDLNE